MSSQYLSDAFLRNVADRAADEPLAPAYQRLIAAADRALDQKPLSIRDNGGSPYYRVDAVYIPGQDGVINPESNREGSSLAARTARASTDLAMAYRFTGEHRYADKALTLIHAWCIDNDTRMFPTGRVHDPFTPGARYGGDVVMFIAFWELFHAIYLLADYPRWNVRPHAAVRRWVRDMVEPQRELMFFGGTEMYNNWEDERLLYLAHGALALDDLDLLAYTFDRWRQIIPMKMTDQGELPRETMRTRSMSYTLMALHAATLLAEIGQQFGENLYDASLEGKNLKLAIDYAAKYLLDMDQWPHQMINPLADERKIIQHLSLFELAHHHWGDPQYLQVLKAYDARPAMQGYATLLYASPDRP